MKILLLGEYSGLHSNLKDGLIALGHEVVLAADGDGFKEISSDINYRPRLSGMAGRVERTIKIFSNYKNFTGHDILQIINPFCLFSRNPISKLIYGFLFKNNAKSFLMAAGDDAYVWKFGLPSLRYSWAEDFLKYDLKSPQCFYQKRKAIELNDFVVKNVNGVIPIAFEYEVSYANCAKRLKTIPLPINLNKVQYTQIKRKEKLVVFHGLNRYGFKGTRHVEEAFNILKRKYPNDLDLIIDGNMPINKYLDLLSKVDVVIDQLNSYSYGMNAIYAMAMGKIVLGGAEPEALNSLNIRSCPVINVKPSAESVVTAIEQLLDKRNEIPEMSYQSRIFVEQNHDCVNIAQCYIDQWMAAI